MKTDNLEKLTRSSTKDRGSPINGIDSLVSGIFSAMANMKTENARMTVTPRAIFSPESGGMQKTRTVRVDIIMQGNTMLYM